MNLLLFSAADRLDPHHIRVTGRRLRHLNEVHRSRVGDPLRVGEIDGLVGDAQVLAIDAREAVLAVDLHSAPPPKLPLRLVLALPRPKVLRRVLRSVAEFGVPELHLIHSYRVEKSYWQTPVLADATLRDCLLQGLEQARDTRLPAVTCHRRFKPFVEDLLPALCTGRNALLAHPGGHRPCPPVITGPALLAIGPEGGFIPYEVALLQAAGCDAVSLGPRILRVENALAGLLSRAAASGAGSDS